MSPTLTRPTPTTLLTPSTTTTTTSSSSSSTSPTTFSQDISRAILSASSHIPKAVVDPTSTTTSAPCHTEKNTLEWEFPLPPPPPPSPVEMRRFWA
ncbi:hypothetical protein BO94DRAFT_540098 [Aspergillus sclerotioniger CBS 115572]|uniref:Uncharacterized protein n=1 Tax=Aspergillus sclerotioniger CBS 115572 TaxID=1450535 RepID=A0A317V8N8_9EURO|nr:hypothetical protein BO94DRAFT_540098 [Aspergillus sclerotioniger CBS 115572]PWY69212.1 hypothetical protein BO94DRAFT_540098 [Aspergillus sclerotioniger CBS 115572]